MFHHAVDTHFFPFFINMLTDADSLPPVLFQTSCLLPGYGGVGQVPGPRLATESQDAFLAAFQRSTSPLPGALHKAGLYLWKTFSPWGQGEARHSSDRRHFSRAQLPVCVDGPLEALRHSGPTNPSSSKGWYFGRSNRFRVRLPGPGLWRPGLACGLERVPWSSLSHGCLQAQV